MAKEQTSQRPYINPALQEIIKLIQEGNMQANNVQGLLANKLRAMAIHHLEHSDSLVARSFRGEYIHTVSDKASPNAVRKAYKKFLNKQSKPGTWGSYIEATALADLFQIQLLVSDFNDRHVLRKTTVNYSPEGIQTPLVMHLNCHGYKHWSFDGAASTQGNGNCLYNSIAQFAHYTATHFCPPEKPQASVTSNRQSFTNTAKNEEFRKAVDYQKELVNQYGSVEMPTEADFKAEKIRISRLPQSEQEQIAKDYELALELALEECQPVYTETNKFLSEVFHADNEAQHLISPIPA